MFSISQAGISVGVEDRSRTDGWADGSLVTIRYLGSGTFRPVLLWVPLGDSTAQSSLIEASPGVWTFSPTPACYGKFRIQGIENEGKSTERRLVRTFGIRDELGLLVPAFGERACALANLANASPALVALSEDNSTDDPIPALAAVPWAGWHRDIERLHRVLRSGGASRRWRTLINTDFAAQPNTPFMEGDGDYVIGGNTWFAWGNGYREDRPTPGPFGIANGVGLEFPRGSYDGVGSTVESSFPLNVPMLQIRPFGSIPQGTPIRVSIQSGGNNAWDQAAIYAAITAPMRNYFDDRAQVGRIVKLINQPGADTVVSIWGYSCLGTDLGVAVETGGGSCPGTGVNVVGFDMPQGLGATNPCNWRSGVERAAPFERGDFVRPEGQMIFASRASESYIICPFDHRGGQNWQLSLCAVNPTDGANQYVAIRSVKLEAFY